MLLQLRGQAAAHPTRMPSSMSVGATLSPRPTTNCAATPQVHGWQHPVQAKQLEGYLGYLLDVDHIFCCVCSWVHDFGTSCHLSV